MKRARWVAAVTCGVLCFAIWGCGQNEAADSRTAAPNPDNFNPDLATIPPDSPQLAQIRTEPVEMRLVPVGAVSAPGKVEANTNRLSRVVLPVTGRITAVLVKAGDFVRQGQPLLTLESADIDGAVSAYQQAQAAVAQARSALAKAQVDFDRARDLFQHGAIPEKEVLNAETVKVQAQASVEQAQAAEEQARRRLEILGVSAGSFGQRVTIRAPISGKILEMSVVSGEFRNDLSSPLMVIADLSSVWVTSDVPETSIRFIRIGEPVRIELSAYPGETFGGRVTLIGDTVNPQTRTVKVRAVLPNPDGRLKPEMFGNIQLAEQTAEKPTVPASAVIAADGRNFVWRQAGKGIFQKVAITTGAQIGDRIAVLAGLHSNDRVVVDGVMLLTAQ